GGVGKSTVAANLALALAGDGRRRVGLIDADVYGPSLPLLFGTDARPRVTAAKRIHPVERYGIALMSMGFFLDESSPVIWRGPIVAADPGHPVSRMFAELAERVADAVARTDAASAGAHV